MTSCIVFSPSAPRIEVNEQSIPHAGRVDASSLDIGATSFGSVTQYDYEFDIPSNDDHVMRDGFHRLTQPTKLLTFEPHLHSSGKRMCLEALYPNNAKCSVAPTATPTGRRRGWLFFLPLGG